MDEKSAVTEPRQVAAARRTLYVFGILLALVAGSCTGRNTLEELKRDPAGMLVYPGAELNSVVGSTLDGISVTRTYVVGTSPTAGQVLDWYASRLSSYGLRTRTTTGGSSSSIDRTFSGGGRWVDVNVVFVGASPPGEGAQGATELGPGSPALLEPVSQITVTIN